MVTFVNNRIAVLKIILALDGRDLEMNVKLAAGASKKEI
jgi:hypothetical protein